ncbi:MAG TPA: universal stress protein [Polyangiaceae bacterium]
MAEAKKPYVIVVGVDYSDSGELALTRAFELAAQQRPAEVHILNVMPLNLPLLAPEFASNAVSASINEAAERLSAHVEKRALAFRASRADDARLDGVKIVPHIRTDSPAFEVAQLAADLEADLVVVGTHGRRALARVLVGSVAELTVRLAPCPVLVVRQKMRPAPVPSIEPPCPRCVETRTATAGKELWCEQHRERHGQRHTYHQGDRASAETNMPLIGRM